jgi:hypothetical protein
MRRDIAAFFFLSYCCRSVEMGRTLWLTQWNPLKFIDDKNNQEKFKHGRQYCMLTRSIIYMEERKSWRTGDRSNNFD